MLLLHALASVGCKCFRCVQCFLSCLLLTIKGHEFHFWAIDALLCEALASGEDNFGLILLLIADGNAILVFLRAS